MIVLKIIGIVAAVLVLLILLLLAVPLDLVVRRTDQKDLRLYLRVCGLPFRLNGKPKKAKKSKKKKKESKLSALLKRSFGMKHAGESPSKKKAEAAAPALQETLTTILELVQDVLRAVQKCKVLRFRVQVVCGGEDAPLTYGTACAVVYPLAAWLEDHLRIGRRAMDIQLGCDYEQETLGFDVDFIMRIRVWRVVVTLWRVVRRKIEE